MIPLAALTSLDFEFVDLACDVRRIETLGPEKNDFTDRRKFFWVHDKFALVEHESIRSRADAVASACRETLRVRAASARSKDHSTLHESLSNLFSRDL